MEFYIAKLAKQSFFGQIDKMSLTASLKVDISYKNIVCTLLYTLTALFNEGRHFFNKVQSVIWLQAIKINEK